MAVLFRQTLLFTAFALSAAACSDRAELLTETPAVASRAASQHANPHQLLSRRTPYYCVAGRLTSGSTNHYEYGGRPVSFPRSELADNGSSYTYRVRSFDGNGRIAGEARCLIPNTPSAIRRIDRIFRVERDKQNHTDGGFSTQGDPIPLDGYTGYACRYGGTYPYCNYEPQQTSTQVQCAADDPYCGSGGTDGGDGWNWGTSGSDPTPPEPDEPDDPEEIVRPECERTPAGACKLVHADDAQWDRLGELINRMTEQTEYCAGAKRIAQSFHAQGKEAGRIQLWNGKDLYLDPAGAEKMHWGRNAFDANGRLLAFDSYMVFNRRSLLAHEALHAYLATLAPTSGLMPPDNETWVREHQGECAG